MAVWASGWRVFVCRVGVGLRGVKRFRVCRLSQSGERVGNPRPSPGSHELPRASLQSRYVYPSFTTLNYYNLLQRQNGPGVYWGSTVFLRGSLLPSLQTCVVECCLAFSAYLNP